MAIKVNGVVVVDNSRVVTNVDIDASLLSGTISDSLLPSTINAQNLTLSGDLTVNGTTTSVNSTVTTLNDPVLTLADNSTASGDSKDRGIEFKYGDGSNIKTGFFGFDDSDSRFKFIPDATNTSEVFSGTIGDIEANSFIGSLTGNADTATNADQLDGQHGSFYQDASNLNSGTISDARLPNTISSDITGNAATATSAVDSDTLDGQHGLFYQNASNLNSGTINDARLPATISSDITGNAATADKLAAAITLALGGDVSGSVSFDGSGNVTISTTIDPNVLPSGAEGGGTDEVFYENDTNITQNYTITSGKNAMSAGPITVDQGVVVTVPTGSVWSIV